MVAGRLGRCDRGMGRTPATKCHARCCLIFEKPAGIIPTIRTVLNPFGRKIVCSFVYGSVASAKEHAASDIDLMVIGDVGLAELTPALRKVERSLGRELNATTYSVDE